MPEFSFIMPAWKALYLHEAIESIVAQTAPEWELVVVDDCSPEDLKSIVGSFGDSRIRYERNPENIGGADLVAQWNHCLSFARGEYVVLAADDDLYAPDFLQECRRLARKYPQADVIRSAVEQIDGRGAHLEDDWILPEFTGAAEYFRLWVSGKAFTCIGNFAFRKSALERLGGFLRFPCAFGSDIATPIELAAGGVAHTSGMLFRFRQSEQHLSADSSRYLEKLEAIGQLSRYLIEKNRTYQAVDEKYLHDKCNYDYFNLVIKYLPISKLGYLKHCTEATPADKALMLLRYFKTKLCKRH